MPEPRSDAPAAAPPARADVLVIGSGAGGALTAATLAERGYDVVVLEEGPALDTGAIATNSPEAIASLYRDAGVTPILGSPNIAFVEGRCLGGSTEVNSAFWHRLPVDCYHRWRADARLLDLSEQQMEPYFETLERELAVSYLDGPAPPSSELFRKGIESMGWELTEVPRCQKQKGTANPFAPGNKQSMQRTYLPRARDAGARIFPGCKVRRLERDRDRISGAVFEVDRGKATTRIRADTVFVCCGAVQTAALLRRSGITHNVGDNLHIHPMLKVAAQFDQEIDAHEDVLPVYQVKEFWPNIAIGGSVFTPGFLAMLLSENWRTTHTVMRDWNRMALFYTAARGMSRGTIRNVPGTTDAVLTRYRLTDADRYNLSQGLAHLGEILFAAGATAIYPSLRTHPVLRSADECHAFIANPLPAAAMSLSTVHVFSSCPMGENPDLCATDSHGKVLGLRNLFVNDASLLPDSPGVNPQGTIMAIAARNVDHFTESGARRPRPSSTAPAKPTTLVTGAPGWLGSRLLEVLQTGLPDVAGLEAPSGDRVIRCLVQPGSGELRGDENLQIAHGDLGNAEALAGFCRGAEGAVLFHVAGLVHPSRSTRELFTTNVAGTRHLLNAASEAGIRRIVAISSNSPFGFNRSPEHRFDESSPYSPYMAYGRSKREMELLLREAHASGRIEVTILRPPWFYGPHQPPRQTLFFSMIRHGRFPVLGDGKQMRSMAYVDNICQGMLLAADSAAAAGQTYWIADERPYSIREIVETVSEVLEEELMLPCAERQLELPGLVGDLARLADAAIQSTGLYNQKIHVLGEMGQTIACSVDKARRELGYAPTVSLRQGMAESVRWCLANGLVID